MLPILLHDPLLNLFFLILLQRGHNDMFHMPRILVLHEIFLPLADDLEDQAGDVGFVAKFCEWREDGFEVEDDAAGEGQAAQGLPVDAQVDARDVQVRGLEVAVFLVRIAWGHVEWLVNL